MPNILILNVGTTSIAYKLFDQQYVELSSGSLPSGDFNASFKQLLRQVINYGDIAIVGHRIVHGGNEYYRPFVVNQYNIQKFKELADFASLYNVPAIEGVEKAMEFLPEATHVSVFDTAFFYELPETAKTYPLPRQIQEAGLRRYGFHGLSHEHAMNEAASVLKIRPNGINLISIHLGDTDSVAAIKSGKPIEISNGCDPRDGLVTMSSSGSLDTNFILQLLHIFQGEISQGKITKVFDILNNGSGIKALCGIDNFQELVREVSLGQTKATAAMDIYLHGLIKCVGSYWALLEGRVDAIALTGTNGTGYPLFKERLTRRLRFLGEKLPVLAIKPNEELVAAKKIKEYLSLNA